MSFDGNNDDDDLEKDDEGLKPDKPLSEGVEDLADELLKGTTGKWIGGISIGANIPVILGGLTLAFNAAAVLPVALGLGVAGLSAYGIFNGVTLLKGNGLKNKPPEAFQYPATKTAVGLAHLSTGLMLFGVAGAASGFGATIGVGALAVYMSLVGALGAIASGNMVLKHPEDAFKKPDIGKVLDDKLGKRDDNDPKPPSP